MSSSDDESAQSRAARRAARRAAPSPEEERNTTVQEARLIHQMREEYAQKLQSTESRVRKQIMDSLKNKEGEVWLSLSETIKKQLVDEEAIKLGSLETERAHLQEELERSYAGKFEQMELGFHDRYQGLIEDFNVKIATARAEWDQTRADEMLALSEEWHARWLQRENDWLSKEREMESQRHDAIETAQREYSDTFERHISTLTASLAERDRRDVELLDEKLSEISSRRDVVETQRATFERSLRDKFDQALQMQRQQDQKARQLLEEQHTREVAALESALRDERKLFAKAREDLERAHGAQLSVLQNTIEEERKQAAQAQASFEESLNVRYSTMLEALQQKVKLEQAAQTKRALAQLEKTARAESERSRADLQVQANAEAAASEKFEALVNDLREGWAREEAQRARMLEGRLRQHYNAVLDHAQAQLQMALQLNDEADQRWLADSEARTRQQVETIKGFEAKCRRLYDARLSEYVAQTDAQISRYEEQLLDSGVQLAEQRSAFESRVRRMKLACAKWRVSYQKDVEERYEKTVSSIEARYLSELQSLLEELAEVREKRSVQTQVLEQKGADLASAEALNRRREEASRADAQASVAAEQDGRRSLAELKEALVKLWGGLQTTDEEKVEVLTAMLQDLPFSPELLSSYERTTQRLSARLPLVKGATRREFLKYRLKYVTRLSQQAGGDAGGELPEGESREGLMVELRDLNESLTASIRRYESKWREQFVFNGGHYLTVISEDKKAMPELRIVPPSSGVSTANPTPPSGSSLALAIKAAKRAKRGGAPGTPGTPGSQGSASSPRR